MKRTALALLLAFGPLTAWAETAVQEVTAENGVRAWLVEDHSLPIVTLRVAFEDAGSARDPAGREGIAYLTAHLLDEGAGDRDALAFHQAVEDRAIKFGADADEDAINLSTQTLSEFKTDALALFTQALAAPRFDAPAVARIKAEIAGELREGESDPTYLASRAWKRLAFGNHPYAHPRRGTEASLAAIDPAALHAFAQAHLDCGPKAIAVVGDITSVEVRRWLGSLPHPSCPPPPKLARAILPEGGRPALTKLPVPQTVFEAGLPGLARDDPRYYALVVLSHVLGGNSLTSRLGREIRDKRGLAYYAEMEIQERDRAAYLAVRFATRNDKAQTALNLFERVLADVATNGVSSAEVEDAKRYLTGSFPLQLDNQASLSEYLILMQHWHLGRDYLTRRNSFLDAVTPAQVNALARELLSHKPLIAMAGSPAGAR